MWGVRFLVCAHGPNAHRSLPTLGLLPMLIFIISRFGNIINPAIEYSKFY